MPSPRKPRARSRQRVKSASRSSSRGRSKRTPSAGTAKRTRSSTGVSKEPTETKTKSSEVEGQEKASVTPVRQSRAIAAIVAQEKMASTMSVEKITTITKAAISQEKTTQTKAANSQDKEKPMAPTKIYEFGGPIGTFFLIFALPATVFLVNVACNGKGNCTILKVASISANPSDYFDVEATLIYLGWFFFQALLAVLPIGSVVEGQPLRNGERLKYRLNGFLALIISLLAFGGSVYLGLPLQVLHKKYFQLMTTAITFSFTLSVFLYIKSRYVPKNQLASPGNSGNIIYDFFMGHELNPRIGPLDLKCFCELRPGLIGWVMLNLSFLYEAYMSTKTFPPALTMVVVFQFIYVADALWNEDAILTTMDIVHDGFGFMLAFGDLAWVPFLYCLQPRFLLENKFNLPSYCLAPILVLKFIGFYIFRASNSQKNEFRKNPSSSSVANLETIPTASGKKLLVSGWWGFVRKPNYLGDLLMALSWSLPCGFGSILPYFYPIYFFVLLVHRERRDAAECKRKYGASWDRYCERVKHRIIPYVY